jgi:hypothetical protein
VVFAVFFDSFDSFIHCRATNAVYCLRRFSTDGRRFATDLRIQSAGSKILSHFLLCSLPIDSNTILAMTTLNPKDLYQLSVQDENVPPVISSAPGITPAKPVVRKQPPKPLPIKKTRATKKKKKKTGIKQNRSAYNFFVSDFSQDRPGIGLGQFASQASQHYHALSTEQKANYTQLAKQDKLRYEKENTAFVERLQQTCAFEKLFQDINAASVICSFLGVKSLVRTLSCSKKLQTLDLLPWEVRM